MVLLLTWIFIRFFLICSLEYSDQQSLVGDDFGGSFGNGALPSPARQPTGQWLDRSIVETLGPQTEPGPMVEHRLPSHHDRPHGHSAMRPGKCHLPNVRPNTPAFVYTLKAR